MSEEILEPEETTVRWFGPGRPAHLSPRCQALVPVGHCVGCDEPLQDDDQGVVLPLVADTEQYAEVAWHHHCFMRDLLGPSHPQAKRPPREPIE